MKNNIFYKSSALLLVASMTLFSCDLFNLNWGGNKYTIGHFPTSPVNLEEFNTEFDDYNSDIPVFLDVFPFCFSSNRNSKGENFDIVYKLMSVEFSKKNGKLDIYEETRANLSVHIENENINKALNKINSPFDEFGPCLIPMGRTSGGTNMNGRFETYIFLYSNNSNGNQDIFFTQNLENENYEDPIAVEFLNSDFDDAYPTFNNNNSEIYFTSNRGGKFDIYKVETDNSKEIVEILAENSSASVEKDGVLSSGFDDKCPSITNNILVFASNRVGGFGGYDLYYSVFENRKWSEPVNFGSEINSEYDEFRPIVRSDKWEFDNDMMIFSSNRPGGKGGFDLYFVGIERKKITN
ncbi:TolB family protein [Mariniphaga sp.]|uniref:TolB family protein n=1 Tax=Mariniphaga sp. TaxID=1954475 RepID=UPI0035659351